jgi:hypothetical protein
MENPVPNPKLLPCEIRPVSHNGQPALFLKNKLGLVDQGVVVPQGLAPLLQLLDGERDANALRISLMLRFGISLSSSQIEQVIKQMDDALLLETSRYQDAYTQVLSEYRSAKYRAPTLAGVSYPADPEALQTVLDGYLRPYAGSPGFENIRGLLCPHIDYARGHSTYAQTWAQATTAARQAELAIIFGTDHAGSETTFTLTNQSYATPWGILPTDRMLVRALAVALGEEAAFAAELHHRYEHSIELAIIWLHHARRGEPLSVLPVLCGSFAAVLQSSGLPEDQPGRAAAVQLLRQATANRGTLVIAAGDLSHVGPAFDDPQPLGPIEKASLAGEDQRLLQAASQGDAERFLDILKGNGDRHRVCGLPPVYWALRVLEPCQGDTLAYQQCPADQPGGSWVSIAGALWR